MPRIIADNGITVTVEREDGTTFELPKELAGSLSGFPVPDVAPPLGQEQLGQQLGATSPGVTPTTPPPGQTPTVAALGAAPRIPDPSQFGVGEVTVARPIEEISPEEQQLGALRGAPTRPTQLPRVEPVLPQPDVISGAPPGEIDIARQRQQERAAEAEAAALAQQRPPTPSEERSQLYFEEVRAIDRIAELEAGRAAGVAVRLEDINEENARRLKNRERLQELNREETQREEAEFETERNAWAAQKVEPGRLWAEASTGQKILGAISLFIGGFLEPVTGKNTALQIIQRAIDRDINAQKVNIEKGLVALKLKDSFLARARQRRQDDVTSVTQNMILYLEGASREVDAFSRQFEAPLILQRAQILKSQLG